MNVIQVGLVDQTGNIDPELLHETAAALNIQVIRDLPQYWNIRATVLYLPHGKRIPTGVWPVYLVASLPPGEGGFHLDRHNQPYAKVVASPSSTEWTIDASHEVLEMLIDPHGNRLQSGRSITVAHDGSIQDGDGEFNYLVEASDPCEADNYGYSIQGIAVSDFITPHFYDGAASPGVKYSFTGAIPAPRRLLPGGYISYINLATNEWEQILWVNPTQPPTVKVLGPANGAHSLRVWMDSNVAAHRNQHGYKRALNHALLARCEHHRAQLAAAAPIERP